MIYASALIEEVSHDLMDQFSGDEYSRWTQADLLRYLNAAEMQTVFFKPQSNVVTGTYRLIAGVAQSLPDGTSSYQTPSAVTLKKAIELISINRNMGTTGLVAGETIYPVDPKEMDSVVPGWRSVTASATVVHSMFDPDDRTSFDVYPAQPTSSMGWIEAIYSAVPDTIAVADDDYEVAITLPDEYGPALRSYMKFRAYARDSKDSTYAYARSLDAWNHFLSLIGRKDLIESRLPSRRAYGNNQPVQE